MALYKLKSTGHIQADSPLSCCQGQIPEPSLRKEVFVQTLSSPGGVHHGGEVTLA